jgi:hypothetical protein
LVDERGNAKLADFGLSNTKAGVHGFKGLKGVIAYMAPEPLLAVIQLKRTERNSVMKFSDCERKWSQTLPFNIFVNASLGNCQAVAWYLDNDPNELHARDAFLSTTLHYAMYSSQNNRPK